jgi:microsomal dipeptidase-like Zn-dependent dipeptidase
MELGLKPKILARVAQIIQAFPPQPKWFEDARGFDNLENGLKKVGFNEEETHDILGNNWYNFYQKFD